ncbi:MAG: hypothetical protein HY270_10715 [Deltaproteobacteria bacterium]|nr:hypothetical protein [Deltaproteobacteria bacterium]
MRAPWFCLFSLIAAAAHATQPSWPIFTDVEFPAAVAADGGRATVVVTVGEDATDIRIEVYGDDHMRVDPDNKLVVQLNALHPGQSFPFEVGFHPGPGRSYIAVSAFAHFTHTAGGSIHEFPFGQENAEQLREHQKCVRQDPDGTWIKIMGCDEEPAPPANTPVPATQPAPVAHGEPVADRLPALNIDLGQLRTAPPWERRVRFEGYVVDSYLCPPCPDGAQCKPCLMHTVIFVAATKEHARFSWEAPPSDVVTIAANDPSKFLPGIRYRFEVQVPEQAHAGGVDGNLLRSQRADEPIWAEPSSVSPAPANGE